jgi:hypothetical protein
LNPTDRIEEAQRQLNFNNRQMAAELHVSEHWYSKVVNHHRPASDDLMLRLDDLLRRRKLVSGTRPIEPHLKTGGKPAGVVEEPRGNYRQVASRIPQQRAPSTRQDCEAYAQQLLDAAELSEDPNAWPVIHDRLKKKFPLDEWEESK